MKENRLIYEQKEGASAAPGGPVIDLEQARKAVDAAAQVPGLQGVAEVRMALDVYDAAKARDDREKLKKELDSKVEEKEQLYSDISKALNWQPLQLPSDKAAANFGDQLKEAVRKAIPVDAVINDSVLGAASARAAIEAARAREMLIDIFAEDVKVKVTNSGDLTGKKSFRVKYENKNVVVELSDQDASVAAKPAEVAKSDAEVAAEAAQKEIEGNQSLMTVLGFFGLMPKDTDGNPNYKAAASDPVVKFVAWIFGAKFAENSIAPLVKAASAKWPGIGEKIEGWKKELQGLTGSLTETPVDKIEGLIADLPAHVTPWQASGLEKKYETTVDEVVRGGDLIIEIPATKSVTFNQQTPMTIAFVSGGSKNYDPGENGVRIEGGQDIKIKFGVGAKIPAGSIFDSGVKVVFEKGEEESKPEETPSAAKDEAPTETPAA
jgi:ribosomal protein L14